MSRPSSSDGKPRTSSRPAPKHRAPSAFERLRQRRVGSTFALTALLVAGSGAATASQNLHLAGAAGATSTDAVRGDTTGGAAANIAAGGVNRAAAADGAAGSDVPRADLQARTRRARADRSFDRRAVAQSVAVTSKDQQAIEATRIAAKLANDEAIARTTAESVAAAHDAAEKKAAAARALARKRAALRAARAAAERKARLARSYRLPVSDYRLTARFAQSGSSWSSGSHTGLDFAASSGTPVRAVKAGEIVSAGWAGAYGNRVRIRDGNGVVTYYAHLSRIARSSGRVQTGDVIGYVGSTGNSTGPHLHFEVRPGGGSPIDPYAWLRSKGLNP